MSARPLTKRGEILARLYEKLQTLDAAHFARLPTYRFSPNDFPGIIQVDGGEAVREDEPNTYGIVMDVGIVISARTEGRFSDEDIAPELEDLYGQVLAMVGADITLGGLAQSCTYAQLSPPVALDEREAGHPTVLQVISLEIRRPQSVTSPYQH